MSCKHVALKVLLGSLEAWAKRSCERRARFVRGTAILGLQAKMQRDAGVWWNCAQCATLYCMPVPIFLQSQARGSRSRLGLTNAVELAPALQRRYPLRTCNHDFLLTLSCQSGTTRPAPTRSRGRGRLTLISAAVRQCIRPGVTHLHLRSKSDHRA